MCGFGGVGQVEVCTVTFVAICQCARKLSSFQLGEFAVLEDSPSLKLLVSTCLCYLCQEVIKELFSLDRCVISFLIGCRIFQELLLISEISSHPHGQRDKDKDSLTVRE